MTPQSIANPLAKTLVERQAGREPNEEHDPLVTLPALTDREAFEHLRELLDLSIDFRGADSHAARLERRVGSPEDDGAIVFREAHPVAVTPDAREAREVRRPVLRAVRIVPESDRHRGERRLAHQFPGLQGQ